MTNTPRWAFERVEEERAAFFQVKPNMDNVDVFINNPAGWHAYHMFAAYIARHEVGPDELKDTAHPQTKEPK